jgi:long-chain fatty acid transport protein
MSFHRIDLAYIHGFKNYVDGSGSIPPAFGGREANIHLEEDLVAVSLSHGLQ